MDKQRLGPVLVGMRGSGKSSMAPLLAARLGMQSVDADAELERQQGRTIARIFAEDGELGFRRIERALLLDDLLQREQHGGGHGGGAVLDATVQGGAARARDGLARRAGELIWPGASAAATGPA